MRRAVCGLLAALLSAACSARGPIVGSTSAVRDPRAFGTPDAAFGATTAITLARGVEVWGELLGCDGGRVYLRVHTTQPGAYHAYEWAEVTGIRIYRAGSNAPIVGGTVLGTLSTISHGFFLMFSAPIWILTGAITARYASDKRAFTPGERPTDADQYWLRDRPDPGSRIDQTCAAARPYARFPGGLPAELQAAFDDVR